MNSTQLDAEFSFAADGNTSSRHERVLDEAARQLNSKGVLLTSLAEIAAQLGVSRSAMYYYVADREDLVFQCYQRAAQLTARRLLEATRNGGTAADILRNFVGRMLDPQEPEIAARAEIAMMNQIQRDTIQGLYDALVARVALLIETGQREGVFRKCDVEINARIALSVITWAPLSRAWGPMGSEIPHERMLNATVATLLDGLSSSRSPATIKQLDLSALAPRATKAFDRDGAALAKREMLLRVASRLFNRKGIDATSLEEIAAQVGATKRTVHHHLGSKSELVIACYERAFNMFFFIKDRMLDYQGPRPEALAAAMNALALAYPNDELTPLSPLVGYAALTEDGRRKIDAHSVTLGSAYVGVIGGGVKDGSIPSTIDVEARTLMLPGLVSWLVKDDVPRDAALQQQIANEISNLVSVGFSG